MNQSTLLPLVVKVGAASALLEGRGWWNKNSLIPITEKQAEIYNQTCNLNEDLGSMLATDVMSDARIAQQSSDVSSSCSPISGSQPANYSRSFRVVRMPSKYKYFLMY